MFDNKDKRYMTRGVNEEVDIRLQLLMWSIIDNLNEKGNVEVDYLQVFKLRKEGDFIVIEHYQEVPEYKKLYTLELEDIELNKNLKIYVMDSRKYETMLLPEEY